MTRSPPTIVVEVVSPRPRDGRRDRIDKLADYAGFGVAFYWLVDPQLRTVEVFALKPGGKKELALSASVGRRAIPGCRGLKLDLDALWAELDRFPITEHLEAPRARPLRPARTPKPKARPRTRPTS